MLVGDVMTKIPVTLNSRQNIYEAWKLIADLKVVGLPVVDEGGQVIGIVTRDSLLALGLETIAKYNAQGKVELNTVDNTVASVMQEDVFVVREDMPLQETLSLQYEVFPVVNEKGEVVGILDKGQIGLVLFKEASRMLLQIETILDSAHNGIVAIDKDGIVTIFNKAAEKITRRPKKEAIGKHLSEVIIPQGLLNILKEGKSQLHHKFSVEYSKGTRIYLTNRSPIVENGQVVGAVGVFQDISEIEFISEELDSVKQLNEELNGIIESSYDGILITDVEGKIIKVNRAHERITGVKAEEIQGLTMQDLVKRGIYSRSVVDEVLSKGESVTFSQNQLLITGNPVRNKSGEIFRIVINIRDMTELNQLKEELEASRELSERYQSELAQLRGKLLRQEGLVFNSPKMQDLLEVALRIARVDSTVLIYGESGVGKEVIAKLIHKNSKRSEGPFIPVNCATIPENLLESELFGYERGAFTGANREGKPGLFELAHNGTLFLDEIGELPPHFQVKLLRVIQEREILRIGGNKPRPVNVRIIAATNRDLEALLQEGKFREDLYFRLNVVPLHIPPVRERREEIIPLIYTFKQKFSNEYGIKKEFSPEVFEIFLNYNWPGNVREIENLVERLLVTAPGPVITAKDLPRQLLGDAGLRTPEVSVKGILPLKKAVLELERQLIGSALKQYGSTYKAAKVLKVDQSTVVRKIKRLKLEGLSL